jgi:hypothetical protein
MEENKHELMSLSSEDVSIDLIPLLMKIERLSEFD